jgi:hypothetical protein
MIEVNWRGVFPAVPTQFREDFSLDIDATIRHIDVLLKSRRSRARDAGDGRGKTAPLSSTKKLNCLGLSSLMSTNESQS